MLCIWWDCKGIVYYELLPQNQTINSEKYYSPGPFKGSNLRKAYPELSNHDVAFHRDNARPHLSLTTRQKLLQFGWDVLPHPPYSPDIAPSDFHLFRSLQNSLIGKNFTSLEDCKKHLEEFFAYKTRKFWENFQIA